MPNIAKIARRTVLIGSAAIAGGAAFGWYAYRKPYANPIDGEGIAVLTPYVLIDQSGVTIITPRAEMGQGVHTTLAALVAEELDLDWKTIKVAHGPASKAYHNTAVLEEGVPFAPTDHGWLAETVRGAMAVPAKFLGLQITGGSSSTPDAYEKMRAAGAIARVALMQSAARKLAVPVEQLRTEAGAVIAPDGTRLPYADLAVSAAAEPLPDMPPLKPRAEWKLLGTSLPRVDVVAKSTGTAFFTGDLRLPGMRFGTVRTNPVLGAGLTGHDETDARSVPGFDRTVPVENGLAILASSTWAAFAAADAIRYDWASDAPYPASSEAITATLAASFTPDRQDSRNRDDGDVDAALPADAFQAEYSVPYLAHATMEPMTAAAWLHDGKLEVWAGNQLPTQVLIEAGRLLDLSPEAVEVHTTLMGGGFGRRAEMDIIKQAITVAKAMEGTPVLLTWTREEDMTHDAYRPAAMARVRAHIEDGTITAFDFQAAAPSVIESQVGRLGYSLPGPDATIVQGAWEQPYAFANYRVTGYRVPKGVPVGSWRSVGASQNAFFHDSAVDELAHLAGIDPVLFRLRQMNHLPSIQVLEAVAALSNWGTPVPGRAKGVAFCLSFGVPSAQVIEVENTPDGLRMTNAWAAVDVGIALDPANIEAQVTGGMIYGLSAAIHGQITFADGKVEQQTFWDYEPLRLHQCPPIKVQVLENGEKIRGIGEPGTPPAAPALANAIFALTGERHRNLPLKSALTFA